jgi:hypothetical protein
VSDGAPCGCGETGSWLGPIRFKSGRLDCRFVESPCCLSRRAQDAPLAIRLRCIEVMWSRPRLLLRASRDAARSRSAHRALRRRGLRSAARRSTAGLAGLPRVRPWSGAPDGPSATWRQLSALGCVRAAGAVPAAAARNRRSTGCSRVHTTASRTPRRAGAEAGPATR